MKTEITAHSAFSTACIAHKCNQQQHYYCHHIKLFLFLCRASGCSQTYIKNHISMFVSSPPFPFAHRLHYSGFNLKVYKGAVLHPVQSKSMLYMSYLVTVVVVVVAQTFSNLPIHTFSHKKISWASDLRVNIFQAFYPSASLRKECFTPSLVLLFLHVLKIWSQMFSFASSRACSCCRFICTCAQTKYYLYTADNIAKV